MSATAYRRLEREERGPKPTRDHTALWEQLSPIASVNGDAGVEIRAFCGRKRVSLEALSALGARYAVRDELRCLAFAGLNAAGRVTAIKYRPLSGTSHDSKAEPPSVWLRPIVAGKLDSLDWLVAEGETDACRLYDLVGDSCAIMALPAGAHAFKQEWAALIPRGARVGLCHDADKDGDEGAEKAARIIGGRTYRIRPPVDGGDWCDWDGDREAFRDLVKHQATMAGTSIRDALDASRVDLMAMIRDGIPEREFLPGTGDAIARGKRHHIAGEAKAGKTLTIAVVGALDVVAAGGTVHIFDRENGAEEYARRLEMVLDARHATDELRQLVARNYRYHAWPQLKLEWGKDPAYAEALGGADLVIFDSSRRHLTSVGLTEDSSDDFSVFTDALIDPLMLAGITTIILDNTGHGDKDRARGTSAKADLCDVMFSLKAAEKFGVHRAGRVEMVCTHSRIGEVDGTWTLELGAGEYGSWKRKTGSDALATFRKACVSALTAESPLGREALITAARAHGAKGKSDTLRDWLDDLLGEPAPAIEHGDEGYVLAAYPGPGSGGVTGAPGALTPAPPFKGPGVNPDPEKGSALPIDGWSEDEIQELIDREDEFFGSPNGRPA